MRHGRQPAGAQRRHRAIDVERQLEPEPASEDREIVRAHAAGEKEIHVAHECRRRSVGDHAPTLHQDQPIRRTTGSISCSTANNTSRSLRTPSSAA